jgi:hypothetical protein
VSSAIWQALATGQPAAVLGAAAAALLFVVAIVVALHALGARKRARRLEARLEGLEQRLFRQTPAAAAVAAVVVSTKQREATLSELEGEVNDLLAHWQEIEQLAERAQAQMRALEEGDTDRHGEPHRHDTAMPHGGTGDTTGR